jgi:hypothetical protein
MNLNLPENFKQYKGEVELIFKDIHGNIIDRHRENNIIKVFAKEILAHKLAPANVWDPSANSGSGDWIAHDLDLEQFSPRYIVFGASFDADGNPLDLEDSRFYTADSVTGGYIPVTLGAGAEYDGGLINAVPISEPYRPLKRVERIYFESSYQPAGVPLLEADVRAMYNTIVFETTLTQDEYNGFGTSTSDFFTITEVALVGAKEVGSLGSCECDPRNIFLEGDSSDAALLATANGTTTISLSDTSEDIVNIIKEGDQIKLTGANTTEQDDTDILDQTSPYYLVVSKSLGGADLVLDRTPVNSDGDAITGDVGVFKDGFKIFSHRILSSPARKNASTEIVCRWRISLN